MHCMPCMNYVALVSISLCVQIRIITIPIVSNCVYVCVGCCFWYYNFALGSGLFNSSFRFSTANWMLMFTMCTQIPEFIALVWKKQMSDSLPLEWEEVGRVVWVSGWLGNLVDGWEFFFKKSFFPFLFTLNSILHFFFPLWKSTESMPWNKHGLIVSEMDAVFSYLLFPQTLYKDANPTISWLA